MVVDGRFLGGVGRRWLCSSRRGAHPGVLVLLAYDVLDEHQYIVTGAIVIGTLLAHSLHSSSVSAPLRGLDGDRRC